MFCHITGIDTDLSEQIFCLASSVLEKSALSILFGRDFQMKSTQCTKVRATAETLTKWMKNHRDETEGFSRILSCLLLPAIKAAHSAKTCVKQREKIWSNLDRIRHSPELAHAWNSFLRSAVGPSVDTQYVTQKILEEMIQITFPIPVEKSPVQPTLAVSHLTTLEVNAVRYAAGYVPRALQKKLQKSTHPLKDKLSLCLYEMLERVGESSEDESDLEWTTEWTKKVDRGQLNKVTDSTYSFMAVEMCV